MNSTSAEDENDGTYRATFTLDTDSGERDRSTPHQCTRAWCGAASLRGVIMRRALLLVGIVIVIAIVEWLALDPSGVLKQALLGALAEERSSSTLPKNASDSAGRLDT